MFRPQSDVVHLRAQQNFVKQLVDRFLDGYEVWYVDETTLNLWTYNQKIWMSNKSPQIHFDLPKNYGYNVTIYGAISSRQSQLVYRVYHSGGSNNANTKSFFGHLLRKIDDGDKSVIV